MVWCGIELKINCNLLTGHLHVKKFNYQFHQCAIIVCAPKAGPLSGFSVFSSNILYLCVANDSSTTFIYIFLKLAS